MNCHKVSHLLSAYMDGELPGVEHRQIHSHLGQCTTCNAEYESLLRIKRLLAGMRVQEPRAELPHLILNRVNRAESERRDGGASAWLRHMRARWQQISPPPTLAAFGAGLAAVGMLFTARLTDSPEEMTPAPLGAAQAGMLAAGPLAAENDLGLGSANISMMRPVALTPPALPVNSELSADRPTFGLISRSGAPVRRTFFTIQPVTFQPGR